MNSLIKHSMIPLNHAVLCLDCNSISDGNRDCPACSSKALMNLSAILDRNVSSAASAKLHLAPLQLASHDEYLASVA